MYKGNILERFKENPNEQFNEGDLYVSFEDITYVIKYKFQIVDTINESVYKVYTLERMDNGDEVDELLVAIGARK